MSDNNNNTPERWQELLKSAELRAMSGTLQQLESLIDKVDTTPKQLAEVILRDVSLTSRVLMVANSVTHAPLSASASKGALTQAIVRIGFKSLRAICISVAIMDSLLKKMPNRQELEQCIAQSFDIAVHARNVARKTGANEEDVYIAGLLQNFGELLFWCSSIPENQLYLDLLEHAADSPEQAFKKLSGMDFQDMSIALANEWKLSDLLLESLGAEVTLDTKAVHLGRRISLASRHGWDSSEINKVLQAQLKDLGFDVLNGMEFMREGERESLALAASYELKVAEPEEEADIDGHLPNKLSEKKISNKKESKESPKPTSLIRP